MFRLGNVKIAPEAIIPAFNLSIPKPFNDLVLNCCFNKSIA